MNLIALHTAKAGGVTKRKYINTFIYIYHFYKLWNKDPRYCGPLVWFIKSVCYFFHVGRQASLSKDDLTMNKVNKVSVGRHEIT